MEDVSEGKNYSFPAEEEFLLKHWAETDAFKQQLRRTEGKPEFVFFDGPPFATGLPHYGHLLAGSLKDIVTRYASQTGHHVNRRFGWDCHGLPVEYEIDKKLGIKSREDVFKMGIDKYNEECRSIVMRYSKEWEKTVTRLGRWIDFENDYKTLDPKFMESVWWVFGELWAKDLIYKGFKVMPYSTGCCTSLSNFEAGQNYKDVDDPAVTVAFALDDDPDDAQMVAWTTTPWTLPSNLSLCVNPTFDYIKVKNPATGAVYIVLESLLGAIPGALPKAKKAKGKEAAAPEPGFEVLGRFKGKELEGRTYEPLFPYFARFKENGAFRVVCDEYVTASGGTGVVHQAPAFGEEDYRVGLANGIVQKGGELPCPVDADGRLTKEITDFAGMYVKDADKAIIAKLKAEGRIVAVAVERHSYPFCWRSDTPLIYKATPSWFVRVTAIKDKLLANNAKTHWVPSYVKEKRFHNWLENAHDWAISRTRFWGTPIPLWMSEDGEEVVVISSVQQLEQLSGRQVGDLHRHFIDDITIPSARGKGVLRRVDDVFDCWFESGSMPYAQVHYPFENKEFFLENFPADFVAEGLDQTRGWFYTLMVLSTALFDKPTFKNLVCNGLVLASDGKKMSKRLQNYPDPNDVLSKYGADALRLYLINSPVVRAESLKFKEEGVFAVVKDVFLPWYNAYRFLVQNVLRWQLESGLAFEPAKVDLSKATNVMDRWINAATRLLTNCVRTEMDAYRLYTVVPYLVNFIEQLTNIYVRYNRKRLKGRTGQADSLVALATLYDTLFTLCKVMSPFTPFFTEHMYLNLRRAQAPGAAPESVHFCDVPPASPALPADQHIQQSVQRMQRVIELARVIRERHLKPIKTPLRELVVVHPDQSFLADLAGELNAFVVEELNVRAVVTCCKPLKYATVRAEPQWQVLGKRLGKAMGAAAAAIRGLSTDQIAEYEAAGCITAEGVELQAGDLKVVRDFRAPEGLSAEEVDANGDGELLAVLDLRPDEELQELGMAREVVNRVQKLRKKGGLQATDPVEVFIHIPAAQGDGEAGVLALTAALAAQLSYLRESLGTQPHAGSSLPEHAAVILREEQQMRTGESSVSAFAIVLAHPSLRLRENALLEEAGGDRVQADGLKLWMLSKDQARLGDEVSCVLNGRLHRLRRGHHF